MKSVTPNNFARFRILYPKHATEIYELEKTIEMIEDDELRFKIGARINIELGVVILKNEEVGEALKNLFQKELKSQNSV